MSQKMSPQDLAFMLRVAEGMLSAASKEAALKTAALVARATPLKMSEHRLWWAGFRVGAFTKFGCRAGYPLHYENSLQDHAFFEVAALNFDSPSHPAVYTYLGSLQGWLWADDRATMLDILVGNDRELMRKVV